MFLHYQGPQERYIIVCKARRNNELLGSKVLYNVNPQTFDIEMGITSLFDPLQKKNKVARYGGNDE